MFWAWWKQAVDTVLKYHYCTSGAYLHIKCMEISICVQFELCF